MGSGHRCSTTLTCGEKMASRRERKTGVACGKNKDENVSVL